MSSEKNTEVVGCDASIMKNVWEIRAREHRQKMQLEQERMDKSALPSINQDWANRFTGKLGNSKRVEKKIKPDSYDNDDNIWKGKQTPVPVPPPRGAPSGLLRPGGQDRSFSTQAPNHKDKKQLEKKRLQLLTFITQSQPSAMVWGKSWKYNKSLLPAEGSTATSHWGQCWMFATQQPRTEEGKPWPNGPNTLDPHSLHLWKQADYRGRDSRGIESSPLTEQWQTSWKKADMNQKKDMSSGNGEIGLFALLEETQHHNAGEWTESWQSTKASSQQSVTDPDEGLMDQFVAGKQDADRGVTSRWEGCWRLANHHGCNHSEPLQIKHCYSPEWANAWKTAVVASNNQKSSTPFLRQDDNDKDADCSQTRLTDLHQINNQRRRDLHLRLCSDLEVLAEWNKSWQVVKNNLTPSEEMEKILKTFESLKMKENEKKLHLTSEKVDEQVKHKNEMIVTSQRIHGKSSEGSHYSYDLQAPMRYIRPVSDWKVTWMVSESNDHNDNASLSQWGKAWMLSTEKIEHWAEQMSREERDNEAVEIQPMKEFFFQKAKRLMSQFMDNQTFRDRYPKEEWSASWKASSLLNLQLSLNESSGQSVSSTTDAGSEQGSEFGMSFRLANPMPRMEKPWAESPPNPYHYTVVWPAGKNIIQNKINTSCVQISATLRLWQNSHMFVNSAQINKTKESADPRVIILKQISTRKHLCSYSKKDQSDRKWAGCHLLGKAQPRPKKTSVSVQKLRTDDETRDNSFEEWADSWRYFIQPGTKKQMLSKSLLGWNESWKFLLPPRQPGNSPKAR